MTPDVLVIGAGPAGIATARNLQDAGVSFRIVDRATVPVSTWANLYESLRLNTAGFVSHLPGQRIPLRYGAYPTGKQYYAYTLDYLDKHPIPIEYGVTVRSVTPIDGGWHVITDHDEAVYRTVVIATGRFGNPYMPPIPGAESFGGRLLHAHDYRDPRAFDGQRVLVVGSGISAADIAVELQGHAVEPIPLAIRSDIVISRFFPYGLPTTVWSLIADLLPKAWRKPFLDRVNFPGYPGMKTLGLPLAFNREDRVGTSTPIRGPELVEGLRGGHIVATAGLKELTSDSAVLDDGTRLSVDAVILCTGYRPVLDNLHIAYESDHDGWPIRRADESQQVAGYPGLYLVGRFYRGLGPLHNIRCEAEIAVREMIAHLSETRTHDAHAHDPIR